MLTCILTQTCYSILDLDPEKSLSSQIQSNGGEDTAIGVPLMEDPKYGELDSLGATF
jgi:hypothetical protein